MELERWPENEIEYWEVIEYLGGYIWHTNHDLSHGRYENSAGLQNDLHTASKIQKKLVSELFVEFGVVHPKDCPKRQYGVETRKAPVGMKWYWDWYEEMKRKVYEIDYNKIICSACPMSHGLDWMVSMGGNIPCSVWPGVLYRLSPPHECGMVKSNVKGWSQEILLHEIFKNKGRKGVVNFFVKDKELRRNAQA